MAFNAFLKIDGIPGSCGDPRHMDWIQIVSYSQGMYQPTSTASSGAGGAVTNRANLSEFSIVKALDKASTKIYESCCKGLHLKSVVVELCHTAGSKLMEIKMEDVIISAVVPTGNTTGADALPSETVNFNFGKILWTYSQERVDGAKAGNITAGWNLVEGKAWS